MPKSSLPLTPREAKLITGIAEGKTGTQAAIDAGYTQNSPAKAASRVLANVDKREAITAILEAHGVTASAMAGKLRSLLDAKAYGITRNGDVVEMGPDAHAQIKALDMAYRLHDAFPNPRLDVDVQLQGAIVVSQRDELAPRPWEQSAPVEAEYTVIPPDQP